MAITLRAQKDPRATPVPFTLADREKLITIEQRLDYLEKRIDHLEKRMDRLEAEVADLRKEMRSYFLTTLILLVSLIGAMGVVFGYLLYERNKILVPLLKMSPAKAGGSVVSSPFVMKNP